MASDRVPEARLAALETSTAVRDALRNPHLRELLLDVRESRDIVAALKAAMQLPIFVEFADACLAVCNASEGVSGGEAAE